MGGFQKFHHSRCFNIFNEDVILRVSIDIKGWFLKFKINWGSEGGSHWLR